MKTYDEDGGLPEEFPGLLDAASVVVIGPGLGKSTAAEQLVHSVIQQAHCPVVMDADALNILAQHPDWMEEVRKKTENCPKAKFILTPHKMELSRLTGDNIQSLQENIIQVCVAFSRNYGVILVAKDARTLVTDGTGSVFVNTSGNDGMACGGSGDVLTGIIAALAAQGSEPLDAARLGVYLHGLAGDEAAKKKGRYGMTASDIAEALPAVMSAL
jgi:NAD(P)H-hydrate epimerase